MDYHGSDCTCIHSPSLGPLIHLFFSFFMRPLTFSSKPVHSLSYSQLLFSTCASFLPLFLSPFFFFPLWFIALNSHSTITAALRYEYLNNSLLSVEKSTNIWLRRDLFLLVTCFTIAPCCVHMVSPSHIEGTGAAYLCYWFSHWLRSSFGKWKHAVCRKRDLEFSFWDVCMPWNVLVHRQELIWLLL